MIFCHSIQDRQVFGSGQLAQSECRSSTRIGHRSQTSYRLTRTSYTDIQRVRSNSAGRHIQTHHQLPSRCVDRVAIVRHLKLDRYGQSGCWRQQSRPFRRAASCRMRSQIGRGASLCSRVVLPICCAASYPSKLGIRGIGVGHREISLDANHHT